ncbi:MAG: dTDP-4-dehydrorhamnose 3,5-epimerase family protein [Planctomycetota bacterium]
MIKDVKIKKLNPIPDERGRVMEILRNDDEIFQKFGQVYITTAYPDVVKAWHYHKIQSDSFAVIHGTMKVVLYDNRKGSPTKGEVNEFFMGEHNPILVRIPPMVYHGFKCISPDEAIMLNCPTEPYHRKKPDEYRLDAHTKKIPYDWTRKDG